MREAGVQGVSPRKWTRTTLRAGKGRAGPELVDRDFTATGPNQLWAADITYVPTWAEFLYLAIVMDVWSRRIVGWDGHPPTNGVGPGGSGRSPDSTDRSDLRLSPSDFFPLPPLG